MALMESVLALWGLYLLYRSAHEDARMMEISSRTWWQMVTTIFGLSGYIAFFYTRPWLAGVLWFVLLYVVTYPENRRVVVPLLALFTVGSAFWAASYPAQLTPRFLTVVVLMLVTAWLGALLGLDGADLLGQWLTILALPGWLAVVALGLGYFFNLLLDVDLSLYGRVNARLTRPFFASFFRGWTWTTQPSQTELERTLWERLRKAWEHENVEERPHPAALWQQIKRELRIPFLPMLYAAYVLTLLFALLPIGEALTGAG